MFGDIRRTPLGSTPGTTAFNHLPPAGGETLRAFFLYRTHVIGITDSISVVIINLFQFYEKSPLFNFHIVNVGL